MSLILWYARTERVSSSVPARVLCRRLHGELVTDADPGAVALHMSSSPSRDQINGLCDRRKSLMSLDL